jgi:hypothetical protein
VFHGRRLDQRLRVLNGDASPYPIVRHSIRHVWQNLPTAVDAVTLHHSYFHGWGTLHAVSGRFMVFVKSVAH